MSCVYYRAAVSAHSSLVILLVFIDTYIVFILLVLEKNKCNRPIPHNVTSGVTNQKNSARSTLSIVLHTTLKTYVARRL